ncbi:MAG: hypothetical protein ISR65_10150 [Bacteriovoracaceae bacterium]|nr:hypothetical protein [Bacteriovoracaceae bacterium]
MADNEKKEKQTSSWTFVVESEGSDDPKKEKSNLLKKKAGKPSLSRRPVSKLELNFENFQKKRKRKEKFRSEMSMYQDPNDADDDEQTDGSSKILYILSVILLAIAGATAYFHFIVKG